MAQLSEPGDKGLDPKLLQAGRVWGFLSQWRDVRWHSNLICLWLFVVCCLSFIVCGLSFVVRCLLFIVCGLSFVVRCLLFAVCCLLLVVVVVVVVVVVDVVVVMVAAVVGIGGHFNVKLFGCSAPITAFEW